MKTLSYIMVAFLLCTISAFGQKSSKSDIQQFQVWDILTETQRLHTEREYDAAIILLNSAIEKFPDNGHLYLQRAASFTLQKNSKIVLQDIKTAISLLPNDEYIAYEGATLLQMRGQLKEALEVINDFIIDNNSSRSSYTLRSEIRFQINDYIGALNDILIRIDIDPYISYGEKRFLFDVLKNLRNDEIVFNYYDQLLILLDQKSRNLLANPPRISSDTEKNIEAAQLTSKKLNELQRNLIADYAKIYYEKGQILKANRILQKIADTEPKVTAYTFRSKVYVDRKNYNEAIKDLTKAIEYLNDQPNKKSNLLLNRGDLYVLAKLYKEAILDYETALNIDTTKEYSVKTKLAIARWKMREDNNQLQ